MRPRRDAAWAPRASRGTELGSAAGRTGRPVWLRLCSAKHGDRPASSAATQKWETAPLRGFGPQNTKPHPHVQPATGALLPHLAPHCLVLPARPRPRAPAESETRGHEQRWFRTAAPPCPFEMLILGGVALPTPVGSLLPRTSRGCRSTRRRSPRAQEGACRGSGPPRGPVGNGPGWGVGWGSRRGARRASRSQRLRSDPRTPIEFEEDFRVLGAPEGTTNVTCQRVDTHRHPEGKPALHTHPNPTHSPSPGALCPESPPQGCPGRAPHTGGLQGVCVLDTTPGRLLSSCAKQSTVSPAPKPGSFRAV